MLKIQGGDRHACEQLVKRHLPALHRFTARMLGNLAESEDAVQETFLRVWSNAHRWQPGKARVSTWLHTIAHNICIDHHRSKRFVTHQEAADHHQTEQSLDDDMVIESEKKRVFTALSALPVSQKTAIILCYYQGFSNKDAAQVIGVSDSAMDSLIARARRSMKKSLLANKEHSDK